MKDTGFADHFKKEDADSQKKRLESRGYTITGPSKVKHVSTLNKNQYRIIRVDIIHLSNQSIFAFRSNVLIGIFCHRGCFPFEFHRLEGTFYCFGKSFFQGFLVSGRLDTDDVQLVKHLEVVRIFGIVTKDSASRYQM